MIPGFESDGCTLWVDGNWRDCCDAHDLAYALHMDKLQADMALGLCVAQHGHPLIGALMLAAVSMFGIFWWVRSARPNQPSKAAQQIPDDQREQ